MSSLYELTNAAFLSISSVITGFPSALLIFANSSATSSVFIVNQLKKKRIAKPKSVP